MSWQAVVLAAGAGSRYGGGKLVADWAGRPLIAAAVTTALAAAVDEVVVVTGCDRAGVEAALAPLAGPRLRLAFADDWASGLSASLKAGVRALPADSGGLLLFLGDMPRIPPGLTAEVLKALQGGAKAVQPWQGDRPAHPVGLSAALFGQLLALEGDTGAASLLRGDNDTVRLQTPDPGAVFDVDHPSDLAEEHLSL
jgi:molybdenum cofactor cytidylyltransferase